MFDCGINKIFSDWESRMETENEKMILKAVQSVGIDIDKEQLEKALFNAKSFYIDGYKDAKKQYASRWIPCSERPPEELTPVNITWVNRNPESYYKDIKDKPFTATGVYYKGKWYWYSSTCEDYLAEYGRNEVDRIDADIEVTAWMPLPEEYKESEQHG